MASCTICSKIPRHVRDKIDLQLLEGIPLRVIAAEHFPDKDPVLVEQILIRHKQNGHIMEKALNNGLEVQTVATIKLADMINAIFERALMLSMKAEAAAVTSRDFESSTRCLDTAIKALALIGVGKEEKEASGVAALEEYIASQRAKRSS